MTDELRDMARELLAAPGLFTNTTGFTGDAEIEAVFAFLLRAKEAGEREATAKLEDKIDGLETDLEEAVAVAMNWGAVQWARDNYPDHPSLPRRQDTGRG